jgi:hypothetical protein
MPELKLYAVEFDVSPSEQFCDDDDAIYSVGSLFALRRPQSIDEVGSAFPDIGKRLTLRKFAGASDIYKRDLRSHLAQIRAQGMVLAGASVVNQRFIKHVGRAVWEKANGTLPEPSSHSKKGRPRVLLGGYMVDGAVRQPYEVLVDDLVVLGWLAYEAISIQIMLTQICGQLVRLHVLLDKLPNEKGTKSQNKGELLKATLARLTEGTIEVVGHPDVSDFHQRDLLVDNLAGLAREITSRESPEAWPSALNEVFSLHRIKIKRGAQPFAQPDLTQHAGI